MGVVCFHCQQAVEGHLKAYDLSGHKSAKKPRPGFSFELSFVFSAVGHPIITSFCFTKGALLENFPRDIIVE